MTWRRLEETLPWFDELVWLYDAKQKKVWLGRRVFKADGDWYWEQAGNNLMVEKDKITSNTVYCDRVPTHWMPLPKLPLGMKGLGNNELMTKTKEAMYNLAKKTNGDDDLDPIIELFERFRRNVE